MINGNSSYTKGLARTRIIGSKDETVQLRCPGWEIPLCFWGFAVSE